MCACVHLDVIQRRIELSLPPLSCSTIDKLQHTFSQSLLLELNTRLGTSPFYQQWFQALHSKRRIRVLKPANLVDCPVAPEHPLLQYIASAFFGHQEHVVVDDAERAAVLEHFQPFGIEVHTPATSDALRCDSNPIYTLTLTKATRHSPALLQRYFAQEKRIVIYDKFPNNTSAIALAIFARQCAANASILILTQPDKIDSGGTACAAAMKAANKSMNISVAAAAHETIREVHDRHIFVGDRYNIRFSSGLDVFGKQLGSAFFNDEGSISVLDVYDNWHPLTLKTVAGQKYSQRVSACG